MTTELAIKEDHAPAVTERSEYEFLTFRVRKQLFGVPVLAVQDVLGPQKLATIPLARPEIAGVLNLRGRIVTAINVRQRLGLKSPPDTPQMNVVVELNNELYSLIVDAVGEVLGLSQDAFESNPSTLDPKWREFSAGIYRLKNELLVILDVASLINVGGKKDDK
ncbi:MAG: chemotaxis protein CheW [Rhodospirillales bacterium]